MTSSNIGSRADADYHDEVDSEWHQFEDLIDIKNFAFYIFLENGTDRPLVMKMTNIAGSTDPNQMITGSYGTYTVTTVIPKQSLEDALGRVLDPVSSNNVSFRVVLLANAPAGTDYEALAVADGQPATFAQFMANAAQLSLNMNENGFYNPLESDSSVDGLYKGAIPMFGTLSFSTTEEALYNSRPEERIYMGDVSMLRSLAKIRVIDAAPKDDDGFPKITSVTVNGSTNMSAMLPYGASTYVNANQVHSINYVAPSPATANKIYRLGYLNDEAVRFGYIPEQVIQAADPVTPVIVITAQLDADRTETYYVPMGGNAEYNVNFGNAILRNHIYTLQVNHIAVGAPAQITIDVADWIPDELNLDYTQAVTVSPRIEWIETTYQSYNQTNGFVYVRPWTADNKPVLLQCNFKIRTPENAKWTAYLIPKEGSNTNAFQFTDKDGNNESPTASGIVSAAETSLTTLYIKPTIQTPTELSSAVLQVVVTLGNGATIEVPMTPSNRNYKNFTIVQNLQ